MNDGRCASAARRAAGVCWLACVLLLASSSLPCLAQQDAMSSAQWLPLVAPIVEKLDGPPKEEFKAKYKPVVYAGKGLPVGDAGQAFGVPIRVVDREQVRSEQLAYFLLISKVEFEDAKAKVQFQRPSSGHLGNLVLEREGEVWKVADVKQMHSSSLARATYGSLFDGIACRDGTEMAGRWNFYASMSAAILAGKPFDYKAEIPRVCPGPEFPEVAQARKQARSADR